ncbi:hypothetical protein J4402_00875 [Candidatus Pacearchaeota archaeon]|nr:hypothetical protein [Candidatus Pacearchaeota archaeon]
MNPLANKSLLESAAIAEQEESRRAGNQIQDNYGICPLSYEGCAKGLTEDQFFTVCSQPQKYLDCIFNQDSGIIEIPRRARA